MNRYTRRDFLKAVGAGATSLAILGHPRLSQLAMAEEGDKMNVLFIAVDDLRTELGCYGQTHMITPNIDALAANGMVFNRAYCQYATCTPSRQSLLTGLRPDSFSLTASTPAMPQHFKNNGYTTISLGKVYGQTADEHLSEWDTRWAPSSSWEGYITPEAEALHAAVDGENADVPDDQVRDGEIAVRAIQEMQSHQSEPFFLAVGFRKPHLPFAAPKKYWDYYNRAEIDLSNNPLRPQGSPEFAYLWSELSDYNGFSGLPDPSDEEARELIHAYYACTSFVDALVGQLLDELDNLSLSDKTIIVLWGDHGWHLGDQAVWGKHTNFESATRAPLIVSVPAMATAGQVTNALVEFVDIYPALSELCELSLPAHLEGLSFVPLLENPARLWKTGAFSQHRHWIEPYSESTGYTIRTDRYRYIEWGGTPPAGGQDPPEVPGEGYGCAEYLGTHTASDYRLPTEPDMTVVYTGSEIVFTALEGDSGWCALSFSGPSTPEFSMGHDYTLTAIVNSATIIDGINPNDYMGFRMKCGSVKDSQASICFVRQTNGSVSLQGFKRSTPGWSTPLGDVPNFTNFPVTLTIARAGDNITMSAVGGDSTPYDLGSFSGALGAVQTPEVIADGAGQTISVPSVSIITTDDIPIVNCSEPLAGAGEPLAAAGEILAGEGEIPVARELYDYNVDDSEIVNVVDDPAYADVVQELTEKLHAGWQGSLPLVKFQDFANFAGQWRQTGPLPADLDESGIVDSNDLKLFVDYWLKLRPDGWPLE